MKKKALAAVILLLFVTAASSLLLDNLMEMNIDSSVKTSDKLGFQDGGTLVWLEEDSSEDFTLDSNGTTFDLVFDDDISLNDTSPELVSNETDDITKFTIKALESDTTLIKECIINNVNGSDQCTETFSTNKLREIEVEFEVAPSIDLSSETYVSLEADSSG